MGQFGQKSQIIFRIDDQRLPRPPRELLEIRHGTDGQPGLPQALQVNHNALPATLKTWSAPVSNDLVAIEFEQPIGASDALRTGSYAKTLTFTLSTDQP